MMRAMRLISSGTMISGNFGICEAVGPNPAFIQCVRWKRKPPWLPTAKSKIFRIPKMPNPPKEEVEEMKRLMNNYRTLMKSIRVYLTELASKNEVKTDEETMKKLEEEDFMRCYAINEEWNKERARAREDRLAKEREATRKKILQNIIDKEKRDAINRKEADEHIRRIKSEVVTFITPENLDETIEKVIANVVNHNIAIDQDGNTYDGKYVEPSKQTRYSKDKFQAAQ